MRRPTRVAAAVSLVIAGAACAGAPAVQPAAPPPSPVTTLEPTVTSNPQPAPSSSSTSSTTATSTVVTTSTVTASTVTASTVTTSTTAGMVPEGFGLVAARATEPDGTVCELCLWIADSEEQRARGLMSVTDLGPADGMAFVYPVPTTGAFWMKNTVMPLSIAFFGADGRYLDRFDMEPCEADPCEHYPTPPDFVIAVETAQGDLERLSMVPGSTFELLGDTCPGR